jgi:hypothetical protein
MQVSEKAQKKVKICNESSKLTKKLQSLQEKLEAH